MDELISVLRQIVSDINEFDDDPELGIERLKADAVDAERVIAEVTEVV